MLVILLTSTAVLALTSTTFVVYEIIASSQELKRNVEIAGQIIAAQASAPLVYQGEEGAQEILSALKVAENIEIGAVYDANAILFAYYPTNAPPTSFPAHPPKLGVSFTWQNLESCLPIHQNEKRVGWLYLKSNLAPIYDRLRLYSITGTVVLIGSFLMALLLSNHLQRGISDPILQLANLAQLVSRDRDYSVRAPKTSADEVGVLTEAFNHMLGQIQDRENALRESADRLRLALQAARIGTWDWHLASNQVYWDDSIYRQFGLEDGTSATSFEEFMNRVLPDDRELVRRGVQDALRDRREFEVEFRVRWPDGSIHFVASRGKAVLDTFGNPVRMTGVSLEITELKKAEQAHAFLAAIVESSQDAIVGKDLSGTIISWNRGAQRMFGYSAAEIVGESIARLTLPEHPNEEENILQRIREGSRVEHYETGRRHKNGKIVQVSLSASPIQSSTGAIVGVSSIARDITERKRAEEVLAHQAAVLREQAQLLDLANVLARDLDDKIILWSAGMEQLYGWSKTEAFNRECHTLLSTEFFEPEAEINQKLLTTGEWSGELLHQRKDGVRLLVASRWVLHRDETGKPTAILEVNNDVTKRKQAEEEIRRLNSDLEQRVQDRTMELTSANQELEAFTYSVSHDLRAPLRHIDAFARILQEELGANCSSELRGYIDRIRKGTQTMGQLVDDLLNLSRVGRAQLGRQQVHLNGVVEEVVSELKAEMGERTVEWHLGDLPLAECDSGLIRQVFANLLSNAVKYTRPRARAVIRIGSVVIDGESAIFVRDNGVGFDMKYAHKLFGVFERLHRAEDFEGTGIGLATVRRIVQRHGGRVWAESEVDQGSCFYFTLPDSKLSHRSLPLQAQLP